MSADLPSKALLPVSVASFIKDLKSSALGTYTTDQITSYTRQLRVALKVDKEVGKRVGHAMFSQSLRVMFLSA